MKKIGFIDYYISEWHANNYPKWISEASERLGEDFKVSYAWAELDVSPVDGVTTDEWCEKFGAEKCETLAELCEKSDVILLLAPSNPEKHLQYAKAVLPYGKTTYIDKTFAPDLATAEEIKTKSVAELDALIDEAFSFDNFRWQQENKLLIDEPFRADGHGCRLLGRGVYRASGRDGGQKAGRGCQTHPLRRMR